MATGSNNEALVEEQVERLARRVQELERLSPRKETPREPADTPAVDTGAARYRASFEAVDDDADIALLKGLIARAEAAKAECVLYRGQTKGKGGGGGGRGQLKKVKLERDELRLRVLELEMEVREANAGRDDAERRAEMDRRVFGAMVREDRAAYVRELNALRQQLAAAQRGAVLVARNRNRALADEIAALEAEELGLRAEAAGGD